MTETERNGLPIIEFADAAAFEQWLEENHDDSRGVWLRIAKRGSGQTTITYAEALDAALCFGWIDGQKGALDDTHWLQRFTARGPRSRWSQVNRKKATELVDGKRMRPAGIRQVQDAKADGRWEQAYEPQSRAAVPPDLQAALDENPRAKEFFATLTGVRRYAFCYRLTTIKRPETRAKRVARYVELLAEGRTLHD